MLRNQVIALVFRNSISWKSLSLLIDNYLEFSIFCAASKSTWRVDVRLMKGLDPTAELTQCKQVFTALLPK